MAGNVCPFCEGGSELLFRTRDYNRRLSDSPFDYHQCAMCGLVFIGRIPEDLPRYYANGYHTLPRSAADLERIANRIGYQLDLVSRFVSGGRLLEIGAGSGAFAFLARRAGYRVEALEQDAGCCEYLEGVVGVEVTRTRWPHEVLSGRTNRYDVVVMWHVLEHLPAPWKVLDAAARALAPGGIVLIATPNPDALQLRVLRARWPHVDAPRHLYLIPAGWMRRQMKASGLECAMLTTTDRAGLGWNRFGWGQTLVNLLPLPLRRARAVQLMGVAAGGFAATLASVLERSGFNGSTYTAIFRKAETQCAGSGRPRG